jgi:hypothetical protein
MKANQSLVYMYFLMKLKVDINFYLVRIFTCFNHLPLEAWIEEKIMCIHGGIYKNMHIFELVK